LKELARPAHVAAGFQKKLWPLSVDFTAKARSFFSLSPVLRHERGTRKAELKQGKTRYEIATGQIFDGPKFPLGALVFYKAKGDGLSEPGTKPGLFVGWHVSPGLQYKGSVLILDYEAVTSRSHLHWVPKQIQAKEVYFPPTEHSSFLWQERPNKPCST
jgi:hypothetical protein